MTTAPTNLSDYDFMELVAFDGKVESEGFSYAAENYAPRFEFNDLRRLDDYAALRDLWRTRQPAIDAWWDLHRDDGCDLHNAHVNAARKREDDLRLWGARCGNGNVIGVDSEAEARWFVTEPSWSCVAVLRRDVPGGEWVTVD